MQTKFKILRKFEQFQNDLEKNSFEIINLNKTSLAKRYGVSRATIYQWIEIIENEKKE